ncbi:MAG: phage tail protein [Oxalobacter sp.]|nr:MAG: phage tail protein [Oxalobacter sp.]
MQVTGRVFITVKGQRLRSKEGAKLRNFGEVERTGVEADTGVAGYKEATRIPEIECTLIHASDTSLSDLLNIKSENISFDTDTGRSYVLRGAWCTGAFELASGELNVKFQGMKCEEA